MYALQNLPPLRDSIASPEEIKKWPHLKDLRLPRANQADVTILIGQDVTEALWPLELRKGKEGEPYATRTPLGWTLNGPLSTEDMEESAISNFIQADVALDRQVEQFWKLDTSEALADCSPQMSVDDQKVVDIWNRSIVMKEGHYELPIPFKSSPPGLPNNRRTTDRRL